jgi:hypothetical protein
MKKYFLFAAVAGMLASCSSESLTGSDPNIEPTPQDDRVPIEISVASPEVKATTRSVGTVGDVSTGTNIWRGEKVNVFMFEQGTLTLATEGTTPLYNDVALTTPNDGASASGIAYEYYDSSAPVGDDRVRYKYYPATGNFDFWGYYRDDAAGAAPTIGATEVTVPFTITGVQDLMVAKAVPTTAQNTTIGGWDASDQARYYSAFSARRNVQPDMTFKHLLTRLTFSVVGGNDDACGFVAPATLPADGTVYTGVFVKSIKVKSKTTGEIIAAYTGADRTTSQLISFDNTVGPNGDGYDMLSLQSARDAMTGQVSAVYDPTVFTDWTDNTVMTPLLTIDETTGTINTHWSDIMRPTSTTAANPIGGALLVSTENASYDIEVELGQYLLESEDMPVGSGANPEYKIVYSTISKTITPTAPDTEFKQGFSYNVKMTLYGYEKIDITTTLEPWSTGTEVEVVAE